MVIYACPRCGRQRPAEQIKPRICHCNGTVTLMYQQPRFFCDGYCLLAIEDPAW